MTRSRILLAALGAAALSIAPLATQVPLIGATAALAKNGDGGGKGGGDRGGGGREKGSEKGGGKANGKGGSDRSASSRKPDKAPAVEVASNVEAPKNANGALHSELKGLNAVHASASALENAAPNSQVGRIAAYRDAALATIAAAEVAAGADLGVQEALERLAMEESELEALSSGYTGRTSAEVQADIDGLDPADPDYAAKLADLDAELDGAVAHETEVAAGQLEVDAARSDLAISEALASEAEANLVTAETAEADALGIASNGRTLSDDAIAYIRGQLGL